MRIEPVSGVRLNTSPAVEAFLFDFGKVAPAYEYDWSKQESFVKRAAYLNEGGYKGNRRALTGALRRYNAALGADSTTLAQIDRLAEAGTLAVITGQQAGIFTGPAYSIYKAITAIHLARVQTERLGVPIVPVFWIAGEDHDWQEIASVLVPAGDGMTKLTLAESFDGERRSVGLAPIPASTHSLIEQFASLMPDTEFKAEIMVRIQQSVESGPALDPSNTGEQPTLADWFGRLVTWLFAGTGLIVVNSADPALRKLEADFFTQVISEHDQVDAALGRGYDMFASLGYGATVDRQVGSLNLFTYVNGERLPIVGEGDQFWIRDRKEISWSKEQLLERAANHPDLFSTNVVLRPVVQGRLFPDLAYVGGPGEISYFGLYRDVFRALGQQMPIVYPRESYTLIEPPIARILEKQELTLEDVHIRLDEKKQELLEREDRLGLDSLFERFRTGFDEQYDEMVAVLLQLDPNLHFVTDENRKQITVQINKLEEKARQQHRKNSEVALRQFERLKAHLTPGGLQERSVSIMPYLVKYGPDLVRRLGEATSVSDAWIHWAVYLGG